MGRLTPGKFQSPPKASHPSSVMVWSIGFGPGVGRRVGAEVGPGLGPGEVPWFGSEIGRGVGPSKNEPSKMMLHPIAADR